MDRESDSRLIAYLSAQTEWKINSVNLRVNIANGRAEVSSENLFQRISSVLESTVKKDDKDGGPYFEVQVPLPKVRYDSKDPNTYDRWKVYLKLPEEHQTRGHTMWLPGPAYMSKKRFSNS